MTTKTKRTLYQCLNAKYPKEGTRITCSKGHKLPINCSTRAIQRKSPLAPVVCQGCSDYDEMGPPIPKNERGWE